MADPRRPPAPTASLLAALVCSVLLFAAPADAADRPPVTGGSPGRAAPMVEGDPPAAIPGAALPVAGGAEPARTTEGLQRITFADGSQRVDLQGRYRAYSVLTLAPDGTLRLACADDLGGAIALARAAARPAACGPAPRPVFGPREE
jgi:hypothetical protein